MWGYIYITINTITGKKYIGQHKCDHYDKKYIGSGLVLKRAIKEFGKDKFVNFVLRECNSRKSADKWEKVYIYTYNAVKDRTFYNVADGGQGGSTPENNGHRGKKHSEKTKKKMSDSSPWKGKKRDKEESMRMRSFRHYFKTLYECIETGKLYTTKEAVKFLGITTKKAETQIANAAHSGKACYGYHWRKTDERI